MALTPIALIPQVVLGGLMVPMTTNELLKPLMYVMPARWGFEAAIAQERQVIADSSAWVLDLHNSSLSNASDFVQGGRFHCATAQIESSTLPGAWGFVEWNQPGVPLVVLAAMDKISADRGVELASIALAWLLNRPGIVEPLASARVVS